MVYGNFNILIYKWIIWLSVENEIRGKQKKEEKTRKIFYYYFTMNH